MANPPHIWIDSLSFPSPFDFTLAIPLASELRWDSFSIKNELLDDLSAKKARKVSMG
ncbi:hypothetical protein GcM3_108012 [Golovinomyces cichoracearum]|uniref:Uncharacterized protein n=1 Tax=Golovinomyces cichoracearum TaxID=62708 RepID=A0A420I985_9PEZI|nr:hypothetical protein GcM3_108012 [Golovinomyces cichoracearum]